MLSNSRRIGAILFIVFVALEVLPEVAESASLSWRLKSHGFIEIIPEKDRSDFVMYELLTAARDCNRNDIVFLKGQNNLDALNASLHEKFKHIRIPRNYSEKLLQWVESELSDGHFMKMRKMDYGDHVEDYSNAVCFPSGCVDPGDIGNVCCPF